MEQTKPKKKAPEPGPEQPEDESQAGVTYLTYEELRPLTEEEQKNIESLFSQISELSKNEDWKFQYEAVNLLRIANKAVTD